MEIARAQCYCLKRPQTIEILMDLFFLKLMNKTRMIRDHLFRKVNFVVLRILKQVFFNLSYGKLPDSELFPLGQRLDSRDQKPKMLGRTRRMEFLEGKAVYVIKLGILRNNVDCSLDLLLRPFPVQQLDFPIEKAPVLKDGQSQVSGAGIYPEDSKRLF